MSRLVKKPLKIMAGVTISHVGDLVVFKGPKGEEKVKVPQRGTVAVKGEDFTVTPQGASENALADAGTTWALARNAMEGVTQGFVKVLEIEGVGYRAALEGKDLMLFLGYALPVKFPIPAGVTVAIE